MKNPYYLKVFIYTAVVIGTALTLWAFVNQFLPVRHAALGPDGAAVVFTPASGTISAGQQQVIKVRVSPVTATNKINGFDLFFKATGPIKLVSIGNNAAFKDPLRYSVTDTAAEYARVLHFNSGDPSDTIPTETAQAFVEFDLTVQGTGNGTATIQFDGTQSEISGEGTITKTLMDIETTTATYQVGAGGGTSPSVAPPTATTVPVATDTPVPGGGGGTDNCTELPPAYFSGLGYTAKYENHVVTFTGSGGKIIVYQANVPYWGPDWRATAAPIIVQGNSVEAPSGFFQVDFIKQDAEVLASPAYAGANYSGRGVLLAAVNGTRCTGGGGGGTNPTNPPVATDTPVPGGGGGGGGTGTLACGVSCSKDSDCQSGFCNPAGFPLCPTSKPGDPLEGCQLIPPDPTLPSVCAPAACKIDNGINCSCTVGGGGGGGGGGGSQPVSMTLNIKLRLQGIQKKPNVGSADIFQFRLIGPSEIPLYGSFTPDNEGAYTGTLNASAPPGNYYLLVKGPRHIQKKICVSQPTETKPGTYHCSAGQIALKAGANTLDFSQIALLVGDLPMQDGVVDSYDFSYIRQTLGSTNASELAVGDLNRDGIIDTQDVSLILQALAVKYDEE